MIVVPLTTGRTYPFRMATKVQGKAGVVAIDQIRTAAEAGMPTGRFQRPEELGALVACLAGPAAGAITGTTEDEEGHPYIGLDDPDLRIHFDGFEWHIDRIEEANDIGMYSSIAIDLENILTATHTSPTGVDLDAGYISRGFTGAGSDLTGDGTLFAYQDTISGNGPDNLVYGVGQVEGTSGNNKGMGCPRSTWD